MSLEQLRTYLMTDDAKKDLVKKAREAGYEVIEEDLNCVTGGLSDDSGKQDPDSTHLAKPLNENHFWKEPNGGND